MGAGQYQYPAPPSNEEFHYGLYPVDFILETIIRGGIEWFKTDSTAPKKVFGHLMSPWLNTKYGEAKINEIAAFVRKYDITVVQHWALIDQSVPHISIQLLDGSEMVERAGLADFQKTIDTLNMENEVIGRTEVGYAPVLDNIQIGIHAITTPDLVKYLYYLVIYILNSFKPELEARGMQLGTFRATDLSRMNEYLPENMYSRFINFTSFSIASFDKGIVPIVERIIGITVPTAPPHGDAIETPVEVPPPSDTEINPEAGICVEDGETEIKQEV